MTRLVSNRLVSRVNTLRKEGKSWAHICRECGYSEGDYNNLVELQYQIDIAQRGEPIIVDDVVRTNADYVDEQPRWDYTHPDLNDTDDYAMEEYNDLCSEYGQGTVDEYIEEFNVNDLDDFRDKLYDGGRTFSSEESFAEYHVEQEYDIPSYLEVDWEATWSKHLSDDYVYIEGLVFEK
jgi:hypothetical protein